MVFVKHNIRFSERKKKNEHANFEKKKKKYFFFYFLPTVEPPFIKKMSVITKKTNPTTVQITKIRSAA